MNKDAKIVLEEGIKIKSYGESITKKLEVFYNPVMKINRDISLLVIESYFTKKIKFCDPMAASGIRELRFLKTIPNKFDKLVIGDVSDNAIKNIKNNFKLNKLPLKQVELMQGNAINTIASQYYDFIEIDPFGSPVPFLDIAIQRIKHEGILSVTATDSAALCGTYPKKCLRRYGISVTKTLCYDEIGIRNLIAYSQREGAKYDKNLIPVLTIISDHFYKVFFRVEESRTDSLESIKNHKFYKWDKKTQEFKLSDFQKDKNYFGKTYIGKLHNKELVTKMISKLDLLTDNKKCEKMLNSISNEIDTFGYYNVNKLQKEFKFSSSIRFEELFEELKTKKYNVSRTHGSKIGIKTNASAKEIVRIMKKKLYRP